MAGRRPRAGAEQSAKPRPAWLSAVDHLILLSALAATLSLALLLFILMSGGFAAPLIAGSALETVQRNVDLARRAFIWGLWLSLLAALLRHYRTESLGYVTLLAGAACWLVLPWVVRTRVPYDAARELAELARSLMASFQTTGVLIMVLGFLRIVVGRVILLSTAPRVGAITRLPGFATAMAHLSEEPIGAPRPSLMRKCWELHFCRGSLRVNCPRYLEQVACWKQRSGCYCDQGLATRLLDSVGTRTRVQVAEEMQSVQSRARQVEQRTAAGRRLRQPPKKQRRPCGECPIYLDHQKFKYRVLSWFAYPTAAVIIGILISQIRAGYEWADAYLGNVLSRPLPSIPYAQPVQEAPWLTAENAIIVLIGVVIAATILQLTEVAVFRLKL